MMKRILSILIIGSLFLSACSSESVDNSSIEETVSEKVGDIETVNEFGSEEESVRALMGTVTLAQYALNEPLLVYLVGSKGVGKNYAPEGIYYFNGDTMAYTNNTQLKKKKAQMSFTDLSKMSDEEIIDKITEADAWIYWDSPYFFSIVTDQTGNNVKYIAIHNPIIDSRISSALNHTIGTIPVSYEVYSSDYYGFQENYSHGDKVLILRYPNGVDSVILDSPQTTYSNVLVDPSTDDVIDFYSQFDSPGNYMETKESSEKTTSNKSENKQDTGHTQNDTVKEETETSKTEQSQTSLTSNYILPESSSRVLNAADLNDLNLQQLNYARNEIFARHGRMFNSQELQNYFNQMSWYVPLYSPEEFDDSVLSTIEKQNVQILLDAEYALNPNGYTVS